MYGSIRRRLGHVGEHHGRISIVGGSYSADQYSDTANMFCDALARVLLSCYRQFVQVGTGGWSELFTYELEQEASVHVLDGVESEAHGAGFLRVIIRKGSTQTDQLQLCARTLRIHDPHAKRSAWTSGCRWSI